MPEPGVRSREATTAALPFTWYWRSTEEDEEAGIGVGMAGGSWGEGSPKPTMRLSECIQGRVGWPSRMKGSMREGNLSEDMSS